MSREFGSYQSGYFHNQIESGADDCLDGQGELTRLWGKFLQDFYPVAYAISSYEACDSDASFPISENIKHIGTLREDLRAISDYLAPFESIAREAVSEYIKTKEA